MRGSTFLGELSLLITYVFLRHIYFLMDPSFLASIVQDAGGVMYGDIFGTINICYYNIIIVLFK